MPDYWIDSSVMIEAHKGPYAFDIAPGFWEMLDHNFIAGIITSSVSVCDEITRGDKLYNWIRERRRFFVEPAADAQMAYRNIADYVQADYRSDQAAVFLRGADAWLIAPAIVSGGKVTTQEKAVPPGSSKAKIPNVAARFGIVTVDTYEMLRELGVSFRL